MPTIKSNGINIHYEVLGKGEPLLLIMGITAPGSVWNAHVADWQNYFQCILVDNRGVGFSDKPAGDYSSEQMAIDCLGVLDHLGLEKVAIVGVSMGSIIAQQFALQFPNRVNALVLMCPWARCDSYAKGIFQQMVNAKARFTPEEFSLHIQLLIFAKAHWDKPEELVAMEEARIMDGLNPYPQPLHGLKGQAAACVNHHVLEQLPNIKLPTLVIGGKADIFTPVWMAEEVAGAIQGAEIYLYDGLGHGFHFENISDFNPRVRNWLLDKQEEG